MSTEKWWPVEWEIPDTDNAGLWRPLTTLTRWHPTVKRAMRDKDGVALEFHHRLGRPVMDLGQVDDLQLRCILLDLAAKWMRGEDNGKRE